MLLPTAPSDARPGLSGALLAFLGRPQRRALMAQGWLLLPAVYLLACGAFDYVCWISASGWTCVGVGLWLLAPRGLAGTPEPSLIRLLVRQPGVEATGAVAEPTRRQRWARGLVGVGAVLVCTGTGTDLGLWMTARMTGA